MKLCLGKKWCRFTLIANINNPLEECYASNNFNQHIGSKYPKEIQLTFWEKRGFFLNLDMWFHRFYSLAKNQVNYLLDNQMFLFEFKLQQKEIQKLFKI